MTAGMALGHTIVGIPVNRAAVLLLHRIPAAGETGYVRVLVTESFHFLMEASITDGSTTIGTDPDFLYKGEYAPAFIAHECSRARGRVSNMDGGLFGYWVSLHGVVLTNLFGCGLSG